MNRLEVHKIKKTFNSFKTLPILYKETTYIIKLIVPRLFLIMIIHSGGLFNAISANFRKWSNTLKQFVGNLPTNCLSVFGHFVGLALKGLKFKGFT